MDQSNSPAPGIMMLNSVYPSENITNRSTIKTHFLTENQALIVTPEEDLQQNIENLARTN